MASMPLAFGSRSPVNKLDQILHVFWWRIRKDSVAQVENVAGTTPDPCKDVLGPGMDKIVRAQQNCWIEVALDSYGSEDRPCFVYRDSPINTEHVTTRFPHHLQYPSSSYTKVYSRNTPRFQPVEYLFVEG